MTWILAIVIGVLFGVGTYLILQRYLTRIVVGLAIMAHAANLLLLYAGGPAGQPPVIEGEVPAQLAVDVGTRGLADPLPQALALTAIVISFGVTGFLLALAYRSWLLRRSDEVESDVEDRRIARLRHGDQRRGDQR